MQRAREYCKNPYQIKNETILPTDEYRILGDYFKYYDTYMPAFAENYDCICVGSNGIFVDFNKNNPRLMANLTKSFNKKGRRRITKTVRGEAILGSGIADYRLVAICFQDKINMFACSDIKNHQITIHHIKKFYKYARSHDKYRVNCDFNNILAVPENIHTKLLKILEQEDADFDDLDQKDKDKYFNLIDKIADKYNENKITLVTLNNDDVNIQATNKLLISENFLNQYITMQNDYYIFDKFIRLKGIDYFKDNNTIIITPFSISKIIYDDKNKTITNESINPINSPSEFINAKIHCLNTIDNNLYEY